jgi:N-acyl-D-amino-acid deacylase
VERLQPAGGIYHQMHEDDLRRVLAFEDAMIGSDGLPHDEFPHPRLWGTFPRVLGHYSRELGLLSLEEAVRRMTAVPAGVFGLSDRGILRENAYADLVLLDPATVIDTASFESPKQAADGIRQVFVNGRAVWNGAASTGERPGRILRRLRV